MAAHLLLIRQPQLIGLSDHCASYRVGTCNGLPGPIFSTCPGLVHHLFIVYQKKQWQTSLAVLHAKVSQRLHRPERFLTELFPTNWVQVPVGYDATRKLCLTTNLIGVAQIGIRSGKRLSFYYQSLKQ